ncbi:hypothetical protein [Sulfuriflexus mobilis]|uniref:hypothetical protein n=1 Tax=Sulfuriflexus mobilis TaxID=1811807 RepID=UPI000F849DA4|nr:hypothetical protein [Sulfuriflexus mobilis]
MSDLEQTTSPAHPNKNKFNILKWITTDNTHQTVDKANKASPGMRYILAVFLYGTGNKNSLAGTPRNKSSNSNKVLLAPFPCRCLRQAQTYPGPQEPSVQQVSLVSKSHFTANNILTVV